VFLLDNIGEIHIKGLESEGKKINFSKNLIKVVKRGLYLSHNDIERNVNLYTTNENILFKKDEEFKNFSFKKNDLESKLYQIKDKIKNNNNINTMQCNGKNVMDCLQEIEDKLNESHSNIIELTPIKQELDNIIDSDTIINSNFPEHDLFEGIPIKSISLVNPSCSFIDIIKIGVGSFKFSTKYIVPLSVNIIYPFSNNLPLHIPSNSNL